MIQSESYHQVVDAFGQDNVDKLSPEDLEIAYTIKNVGNMTFEQLQTEIQKSKELADENPILLGYVSLLTNKFFKHKIENSHIFRNVFSINREYINVTKNKFT